MVIINGTVPERGDIFKLQFNPQAGREQAGYRPAIVVSPTEYNKISSLILVCPITSRKKGWPFEVELESTMQTIGVVLVDQVKSIDYTIRGAVFVEAAPEAVINEVLARLGPLVS
ncbi:MAG: type II toxin-antitoxin system PemK/MazF family toxin [Thermosynechococcaceae cyanobacterium MS004]|nr:type II toxin-antitoxin system PemK/MazF family toxin [Thermosynechococcaceae cyanobacterium MS004]